MSHYDTLGVEKKATPEEIKTAHRRLARRYHPDVSKETDATEKFKVVQVAFDVLSDPERRAYYDETGFDQKEDDEVEGRSMLAGIMKKAVSVLVDHPEAMPLAVISGMLDATQDTINANKDKLADALVQMRKMKKRLKTKEGVHNMFEAIVDQRIEGAEAMMLTFPSAIKRVGIARRLLGQYEDNISVADMMAKLFGGTFT